MISFAWSMQWPSWYLSAMPSGISTPLSDTGTHLYSVYFCKFMFLGHLCTLSTFNTLLSLQLSSSKDPNVVYWLLSSLWCSYQATKFIKSLQTMEAGQWMPPLYWWFWSASTPFSPITLKTEQLKRSRQLLNLQLSKKDIELHKDKYLS